MTHSVSDSVSEADLTVRRPPSGQPHAAFGYDVDGVGYGCDQPAISGAQIRFVAGLYPRQGLVRVLDDGARVTVGATETVDLSSGACFQRRPRFTRD